MPTIRSEVRAVFDHWIRTVNAKTPEEMVEAYLVCPAKIREVHEFLWERYQSNGNTPESIYFHWFGEWPDSSRELRAVLMDCERNRQRVRLGLEPIPLAEE